jgi:hypothetical protein
MKDESKHWTFGDGITVAIILGLIILQLPLSYIGMQEINNRWSLGSVLRPGRVEVSKSMSYEAAAQQPADCFCITDVEGVK